MGEIISIIFRVIEAIIFIRVIMSWIPSQGEFARLVHTITEPLLAPFRVILPIGNFGGVDLSPIILLFLLEFLQGIVVRLF